MTNLADEIYSEIEIAYTEGGAWHSITVSMEEVFKILTSGYFEQRAVVALKLYSLEQTEGEETKTYSIVYDFLLDSEQMTPWRISE